MKPGGLVIAIVGVWLGCQVFGGEMLERLGMVARTTGGPAKPGTAPTVNTPPAAGPSTDWLPA